NNDVMLIGILPNEYNENFKQLYKVILTKLTDCFGQYASKVQELLSGGIDDKDNLAQIGDVIARMNLLRTIPVILSLTGDEYYKSVLAVFAYVQELKRSAEQFLANFFHFSEQSNVEYNAEAIDEDPNYVKFKQCLISLKNATWLKDISTEDYQEIVTNLEDAIIRHTKRICNYHLQNTTLTLAKYEKLNSVIDKIQKVNSLNSLFEHVPELHEYYKELLNWFEKQQTNNFSIIESIYSSNKLDKMRSELALLEQNKLDFLNLSKEHHPAKEFLKELNVKDIAEIIKAKKAIEDKIEHINDQYNEKINTVNQQAQSLEEIKKNYQAAYTVETGDTSANWLTTPFQFVAQKVTESASQKILKEANFSGIKEICDTISQFLDKNERLIQEKTNLLKEQFQQLKVLEDQIAQYHHLSDENQVPDIAKDFLKGKEFENIEELDKNVISLTKEIAEFTHKGYQDVFDRLDLQTAENALQYLEACHAIPSIAGQVESMQAGLNSFFIRYAKFITISIDNCVKQIVGDGEVEEKRRQGRLLGAYLREVREIEEQYIKVHGRCLAAKDLWRNTQEWNEYFSEQYSTLSKKMSELQLYEDHPGLRKCLSTVNSLSQIDNFLKEVKFRDLHNSCEQQLFKGTKEGIKGARTAIHQRDYQTAHREIINLTTDPDFANNPVVRMLKDAIIRSINNLLADTKAKIVVLDSNITPERVQEPLALLKKIKDAKESVIQFIGSEEELKFTNNMNELNKLISQKISESVAGIEASIGNNSFAEASSRINALQSSLVLLSDNVDREVANKVNSLRECSTNTLSKVMSKYALMPVEQYNYDPPRDLFDRLKINNNEFADLYSEQLRQLQREINENFRTTLKNAEIPGYDFLVLPTSILGSSLINKCPQQRRSAYVLAMDELYYVENPFGPISDAIKFELEDTSLIELKDKLNLSKAKRESESINRRELSETELKTITEITKHHRPTSAEVRAKNIAICKYALTALPETMQGQLKVELEYLEDRIKRAEETQTTNLRTALEVEDIRQVKNGLLQFKEAGNHALVSKFRSEIGTKLMLMRTDIDNDLEQFNLRGAFEKFKKIMEYNIFNNNFPEVNRSITEVAKSFVKIFNDNIYKVLAGLPVTDPASENVRQVVTQSFDWFNVYTDMSHNQELVHEEGVPTNLFAQVFSEEIKNKINDINRIVSEYFDKIESNYQIYKSQLVKHSG
ncbi:MAG: hypothetical protein ACK4PR_06380, partial [Gammaproteobacteria bacterium]